MVAYPDTDSDSDNAHMPTITVNDAMDVDPSQNIPEGTEVPKPVLFNADEPSVELLHPTLHSKFIGVRHPASTNAATVHQFRGIKYATVPKRFRRSVLLEKYASETTATRHGPICPQIKNRWLETRLYGLPPEVIPEPSYIPPEDEWECLNLCITAPAPECKKKQGLVPVMVYFHGGGNVTGSGSEWIWDAGALVRKSLQCSKPVIVVALNFRLGLFGFAASELLREDNTSAGEDGVGNYGLHDQRTALLWIKKYISGFGGDPENVTLFGSSWGAADIHAHLLSNANQAEVTGNNPANDVLFHRAILQSGALVPSNSVVQDVHTAGAHLGRIMQTLDIKTVDELREIPAAKLVSLTGERVRPVDDGVFLRRDWKSLALPLGGPPQRTGKLCRQDVMIGDVACESVLWAIPARLWGADAVARRARAIVQSVRRADALMRAYDITDSNGSNSGSSGRRGPLGEDNAFYESDEEGADSDDDDDGCELAERVMDLINDVAFAWPVDVAARSAADSAFIFEEPVPTKPEGNGYLSAEYFSAGGSESSLSPSPGPSESTSDIASSEATPTHNVRQRPPNAPYVYRYVFDQASPYTQTPHHGVDLLYLFGNIPFPTDPEFTADENEEVNWDRVKVRNEMQERWLAFASGEEPWEPLTPQPPAGTSYFAASNLPTPMLSPSSSFSYGSTRSSVGFLTPSDSSRSSSFSTTGALHLDAFPLADAGTGPISPFIAGPHKGNAHGHMHSPAHRGPHHHHHQHSRLAHVKPPPSPAAEHQPISISESDKVFVFGPEGETGLRSAKIFAGRRRVHAWREALAPLGLATAQKVGLELGNGPPASFNGARY